MTGDNGIEGDEKYYYSFEWNISSESVPAFYSTIKSSLDRWPGGDPIEQEILQEMTKQAYQLLIERSFLEG
jgi:hypothetical protein